MKKQNGIRAVLWTVLMLAAALTGCCADGEDACTLDPADPARFTCGGVEYITLREAVPRDAVGRKLGDIQTLAAVDGEGRVVDTCGVTLSLSALARLEERLPKGGRTVQVLNVWALPGTTDGAVAVMVDGTFRRAVPADVLPPEAEVLSFARQAGGYGEAFAVMPEDCRRLTCGAGGAGRISGRACPLLRVRCGYRAGTDARGAGAYRTGAGAAFRPAAGEPRVRRGVRAGGNGQRIGCGGRGGRRIAAGRSGAARAGRVLTLPSGRPFAASLPEGWRKKRRSQQPEWLRSAFFVFPWAYFRTGAGPVLSRTISCGRSSTLLTATPFIRLSSRLNALLPSASLSCRMVVRGGSQPAASGRSS